jgi:hypothetical protein
MNYSRLYALMFFVICIGCEEKKQTSQKKWFKGNLHTHSYWSDGDEFPEVIMDWYKSNDYQFVALTEHNVLAEIDRWKVISQDSIYQKAFKSYLDTYGSNWVKYKIDSLNQIKVKLKTYQEYKDLFEERGNSVMEVLQNNIDQVISQRDELNIPMIVHINHPNFGYAIRLEDMIGLKDERFFEVYNGHNLVHNSGDSIHMSTESMWDYINIAYVQNHKPLMFGIATDDAHHYHVQGSKWANAGRGWVMVQADSLNPKSLITAMESGQFYASTGVELENLLLDNYQLSIEVKKEIDITYQISFIGYKKGKSKPEEFMSVEGEKAIFQLTDDILFIRSKIISSKLQGNPIEDLLYETAWTQPMIIMNK